MAHFYVFDKGYLVSAFQNLLTIYHLYSANLAHQVSLLILPVCLAGLYVTVIAIVEFEE